MVDASFIQPDWPAPAHIRAVSTTRIGGVSVPPYDTLNLGDHVGDDADHVAQNRALLTHLADLPRPPYWLQQTHSTICIDAIDWQQGIEADACYSRQTGDVCVVMTADCLPLLICDCEGEEVAAVHAGWRGLCEGVIESTLAKFTAPKSELLVWLGPAIGPQAFEVGPEVRDAFLTKESNAAQAFISSVDGRYLANIYQLASQRLKRLGVEAIYGGEHCTVSQPEQFFSYRRDGVTGRMASLIWKTNK